MHVMRRALVSEDEFMQLPESQTQTELIDGEVIVSPAPSGRHQWLVMAVGGAIWSWASGRERPPTILPSPIDVRFGAGRILQPDLALWSPAILLPTKGAIDVIPTICIEVISRDRVYDRVTKRLVYAAAGVPELWIVEQTGLVEVWTGEGLSAAVEHHERLTSAQLPGFELDLGSLRG